MKSTVSIFGFIIVLGTILTTMLVAVDSHTRPIIARHAELTRKAAILQAFEIPYAADAIEQAFADNVREHGVGAEQYYRAADDTAAFVFRGSGLWGPVTGVLALSPNMRDIRRIVIMRQEETPGLGSRIAEREFLDRFAYKRFGTGLKLVPEGKSRAQHEIDGITGATMSSEALLGILNEAYARFTQIVTNDEGL